MGFGNRIKELRSSLDLSQQDFSQKLGMKPQALSRYEKEKVSPSVEIVKRLTDMFSINANWLLTGKGEMFLKDSTPAKTDNTDDIEVNFYEDVAASAGYGTTNYDTAPTRIPLSTLFLKTLGITNPNNIEVIKVYGDSMEPDFHNGEYIVVEKITELSQAKNGNTVIANLDGDIYIKKILKEPFKNKVTLVSTNKFYDPIVIQNEELNNLDLVAVVKGKFRPV